METPLESTSNMPKLPNEDNIVSDKIKINSEEEILEIALKVNKIHGIISKHDYQFRLCLVGDSFVGKTSMLKRYYDKHFNDDYTSTIGCDFKVITLEADYKIIKLQIWDTAGQERFKAISINYFRSAHGFIFVFDITKRETFENVENWINTAFSTNKNNIFNILIGNKRDLIDSEFTNNQYINFNLNPEEEGNGGGMSKEDSMKYNNQREVSQKEAIDLAVRYGMSYMETSAKENINVDEVFHYLTFQLSKKQAFIESNVKHDDDNMSVGTDLDYHLKKKNCCS
jgi:Ras-related protein Rab-1A